MSVLFWSSLALLAYVLVLYPGLMVMLGLIRPRSLARGETLPSVTIIVAACNEERHIGAMLEQLERLDYPRERVERVVALDDGSTDRTLAMVGEAERRGIVRLILPPDGRVGKNVSLDAAMQATRGEIVIFCDATARWRADGIRKLAAAFVDERIGCVSARTAYRLEHGFGASSYKRYWDLEGAVELGSSVLGYLPNASGALHALRRSIYQPVANHMIRDLVDPAQSLGQGQIAVLDPEVPYLDAPWIGASEVYRSRVRITQRALVSTPYILGQLLRSGCPWTLWQYISHKLLRWFLWLPMSLFFLSSACLALGGDPVGMLALGGQLVIAGAAGVAFLRARDGPGRGWHAHIAFLVLSFLAMLQGLLLTVAGRRRSTWRL